MRSHSALIAVGILTTAQIALGQKPRPDAIAAADGDLTILPITHASVSIRHGSDVILIDPARFVPAQPPAPNPTDEEVAQFKRALAVVPSDGEPAPATLVSAFFVRSGQLDRFSALPAPTLILVTDIHTDHLDPRAIAALKSQSTRLVVPVAARSRMLDVQEAEPMANGETKVIGDLTIEAIAMYNLQPDRTSGTDPSCEGPRQWLRSDGWGQTTLRGRRYVMHT